MPRPSRSWQRSSSVGEDVEEVLLGQEVALEVAVEETADEVEAPEQAGQEVEQPRGGSTPLRGGPTSPDQLTSLHSVRVDATGNSGRLRDIVRSQALARGKITSPLETNEILTSLRKEMLNCYTTHCMKVSIKKYIQPFSNLTTKL